MEVFRVCLVLTCVLSSLMMTVDIASGEPVLHYVGGSKEGWRPDLINFTSQWASHEYFKVDDWLYFGYDRHLFNVFQVNETDYMTCSDQHPIMNISKGAGRDVFHLVEAKPYYFISSGGYCWHGMKLAILNIHEIPPPAPAPAPAPTQPPSSKNGSPADFLDVYKTFFGAIAAMVIVLMMT